MKPIDTKSIVNSFHVHLEKYKAILVAELRSMHLY
jgi:hypothetical protein